MNRELASMTIFVHNLKQLLIHIHLANIPRSILQYRKKILNQVYSLLYDLLLHTLNIRLILCLQVLRVIDKILKLILIITSYKLAKKRIKIENNLKRKVGKQRISLIIQPFLQRISVIHNQFSKRHREIVNILIATVMVRSGLITVTLETLMHKIILQIMNMLN